MRAILEKYGLALFVLVVLGIMIAMGPILGNTFSNQLQNEVITYTDHEGEMIVGSTFNSMIPNEATSVVFTWRKAPDGAALTDVSVMGDGSVVAWMDGTTFMVSTQKFEKPILANSNCSRMFKNKTNLVSIVFENLDTSQVTSMWIMFANCKNLVNLDLSTFDTSKVTDMSGMFCGCSSLTSLTLGDKFDTSNVTNMNSMISYCSSLVNLDLSNFNTTKVTDMSYMFSYSSSLTTLDLRSFSTNNNTNMRSMFNGCTNLTKVYVNNSFKTSGYLTEYMFMNCCAQVIRE